MSGRRILVIEDDSDVLEVIQLSLELVAGWEVLGAASGEEGLACATRERPDAILLDVMMPDMDGRVTYHRLQAAVATREIPVVFLTAKVQPIDRRRYAELGVNGIIAKPFDPVELPDQVANLLGWH